MTLHGIYMQVLWRCTSASFFSLLLVHYMALLALDYLPLDAAFAKNKITSLQSCFCLFV